MVRKRDKGIWGRQAVHYMREAMSILRTGTAYSEKSKMIKHWANSHPDLPKCHMFEFSIQEGFKDALTRQVAEATAEFRSVDSRGNIYY